MNQNKTCFAYMKGRCKALNTKKCDGCNFYKTTEQYKQDQQKAIDKILTLNKMLIEYITRTYYKGKLEVKH